MAEDTEKSLADELKKLCYKNGKEKFPKDSAKILHKLGLLYRRKNPDRLSLLQSVALMTSATIREPDNIEEIKRSLDEVCSHVLQLAGSKSSPQSLDDIVSDLKKQLQSFRNDTDEKLSVVEKISYETESGNNNVQALESRRIKEINDLQIGISDWYSNFMSCICQHCVDIMGEPPCKFTLVGLGSLARKEITPYSDFESIIVLEEDVQRSENYKYVLEYFRWLSTLFQMILIRLGETVLRFMAIPCLNDPLDPENNWFYDAYTPCGICPDGFAPAACKNPLGRQTKTARKPWTTELIKPASEMVKYLDREEDLKNGYHLADILMKTCFVFGNKEVFESFENLIFEKKKSLLSDERNETLDRMLVQLDEDFVWFHKLSQSLDRNEFLDLKRYIYRGSTLFVSALGSWYELQEPSCQQIVEKLHTMEVITANDYHKLMLCVAVACEFRLRCYCLSRGQNDLISRIYFVGQKCGVFDDVLQSIGTTAVVSCVTYAELFRTYLTGVFKPIVFMLESGENVPQTMLQKETIDHLQEDPFVRAKVGLQFGFLDASLLDWLEECKKDREFMTYGDRHTDFLTFINCLFYVGDDEGIIVGIRKKISYHQKKTQSHLPNLTFKNSISPSMVIRFYNLLGRKFSDCSKFKSALKYFRKMNSLVHLCKKVELDNFHLKMLYFNTGKCFMGLGRHSKALKYFEKGLEDVVQPEDISKLPINCDLLSMKCHCLRRLKKHAEADKEVKQFLECRKMVTVGDTYDMWTSKFLYDYADNLCERGHPQKALDECERVWNLGGRDELSNNFYYLLIKSNSLFKLCRFQEAYSCFQDLMPWYTNLRSGHLNLVQDPNQLVSHFFGRFAECAIGLGYYKEGVELSKEALLSLQQIKLKSVSDTEGEQDLRYMIVVYTSQFVSNKERNGTLSTNKQETTENQIDTDFQSLCLSGYRAFANNDYVMAVNHFQTALNELPPPPPPPPLAKGAPKHRRNLEKRILQRNSCQLVTDFYRITFSTALRILGRNREALAQCRQAWRESLMLSLYGRIRRIRAIEMLLLVAILPEKSTKQFQVVEFAVTFVQELGVDFKQSLVIDIFRIYLQYCLMYLPECKLVAYAYTPSLYYHAMRTIPGFEDNPDICYELWPNIWKTHIVHHNHRLSKYEKGDRC